MSENNGWATITNGSTVRQKPMDVMFERYPLAEPDTKDALSVRMNELATQIVVKLNNYPQYLLIDPNQHIMLFAAKLRPVPVVHGIGIEIEIDASNDVVAERLKTLLDGVKEEIQPNPEQRAHYQVSCCYCASLKIIGLKVNSFVA